MAKETPKEKESAAPQAPNPPKRSLLQKLTDPTGLCILTVWLGVMLYLHYPNEVLGALPPAAQQWLSPEWRGPVPSPVPTRAPRVITGRAERLVVLDIYRMAGGDNGGLAGRDKWGERMGLDWHVCEVDGVECNKQGQITSLLLNNNTIKSKIPASIGELEHLEGLNLGNNQFYGTIPPQIFHPPKLSAVLLGNNELTGPIPFAAAQTTSLQALAVHNNRITGPIPEALGWEGAQPGLTVSFEGNAIQGELPANSKAVCAKMGSACQGHGTPIAPANGPSSDIDVRWNRDGSPVENSSNPDWDPKGEALVWHKEDDKFAGSEKTVGGEL